MKAIVLIALLALTHSAVAYNSTAYFLGFTDQLGLDVSQLQDAEDCYAQTKRISEDVQNVIYAVKEEGSKQIAAALVDLIDAFTQTTCVAYKEDLLALFTQNTNGTDLQTFAEETFKVYPTQVIQQIGFWIQDIIDEDEYSAGKTEAYILQILFGLETPEVLPAPEFNFSNYVPADINTYLPELFQGLYPTIGLTNQTIIDQISACTLNYYKAIIDISSLSSNLTDKLGHNIQVYSQLVEKLAATVETCTPVFEFEWAADKKLFKIFWESPLLDLGKILLNVAKNLPEIIQRDQNVTIDVMSGKYYEAGILEGEIINTYVDGVFNLTEVFDVDN